MTRDEKPKRPLLGVGWWEAHFDQTWREMAEVGKCDDLGGAEYRRVRQAWRQANRPERIREFIANNAR